MLPSQSWGDLIHRRRARAERSEISWANICPVGIIRSVPDSEMDAFNAGPSCNLDFGVLTESDFEGVPELVDADPPFIASPSESGPTSFSLELGELAAQTHLAAASMVSAEEDAAQATAEADSAAAALIGAARALGEAARNYAAALEHAIAQKAAVLRAMDSERRAAEEWQDMAAIQARLEARDRIARAMTAAARACEIFRWVTPGDPNSRGTDGTAPYNV